MRRFFNFWPCLLLVVFLLAACVPYSANFPQRVAQPDTPPERNFTSFSASLRCMDDLLVSAKRPSVLISSTGIPDLTKKINVSGDDMLVNAISAMNRRSKTYLFVDQSLEKDAGQIAIYTPLSDGTKPNLYVRGAISQIDSPTATDTSFEGTDTVGTRRFSPVNISLDRGVTIVTVDMHLVSFPDKTVVPGSSVANSMVVTGRGIGLGATGLVDLVSLKSSITIDRVESVGQAVRNLIELGTIELIGRHANVQYWECLNIPSTKTKAAERKEFIYSSGDKIRRIPEAQKMLAQLGFYSGDVTGIVDQRTRDALSHFQATYGLIATGRLNYDTFLQLQERTAGYAPRRQAGVAEGQFEDTNGARPIIVNLAQTTEEDRIGASNSSEAVTDQERSTSRGNSLFGLFGTSRSDKSKSLSLRASKRAYRIGDAIEVEFMSTQSGFLTCFHQTMDGPVTQIFPVDPSAVFAVAGGEEVRVPDAKAGFDIRVEWADTPEKILCALERAVTPADITAIAATSPLGPAGAKSFAELKSKYKKITKFVEFAEISVQGR